MQTHKAARAPGQWEDLLGEGKGWDVSSIAQLRAPEGLREGISHLPALLLAQVTHESAVVKPLERPEFLHFAFTPQ